MVKGTSPHAIQGHIIWPDVCVCLGGGGMTGKVTLGCPLLNSCCMFEKYFIGGIIEFIALSGSQFQFKYGGIL